MIERLIEKEPFRITFNESGEMEIGEDIRFCKMAQEEKFKIFCDFNIRADHYKMISLRGMWDNFVMGGKNEYV